MARPLNERLSKALTNTAVRSTELEVLIEEARAERERLTGAMTQANADAINLGLSDEDRDAAAATADRARRDVLALGKAVEGLESKLAARVATEEKQATAARRAALLEERDQIAARLRAEWPAIERAIVGLLSAVTDNAARMRADGIFEPDAEAVARGLPGNFSSGPIQFRQLTKLALPSFVETRELAWPVPVRQAKHFTVLAEETRRKQIEAQQRRDAAEAAAWAPYTVTPGKIDRITEVEGMASRNGPPVLATLYPKGSDAGGRFAESNRTLWLHSREVERLRKHGVEVEAVS